MDLPPEVDVNYMAKAEEIREYAVELLRITESSEDLRFIDEHAKEFSKEQNSECHLWRVLGWAISLRNALQKNDLVALRRERTKGTECILAMFSECRKRMEKILQTITPARDSASSIKDWNWKQYENVQFSGQMSLF